MSPTLPPELVEHILSDYDLDWNDLAHCCLLSHEYLDFARPRLYSHLVIYYVLAEKDRKNNRRSIFDDLLFRYDPQVLDLLSTLTKYPYLAELVQGVRFRSDGYWGCSALDCPFRAGAEVCGLLVEMCDEPSAQRSITFLELGSPTNLMWRMLKLYQVELKHLFFTSTQADWRPLAPAHFPAENELEHLRLESLVFCSIAGESWSGPHQMWSDAATFRRLTASSHFSLTFLHMGYDPEIIRDFDIFPNLVKLELAIDGGTSAAELVKSVGTAAHLAWLRLGCEGMFAKPTRQQQDELFRLGDRSLASNLPLSLRVLGLPAGQSPEQLSSFIDEVSHLPTLRLVEHDNWSTGYDGVAEKCATRNVRLAHHQSAFGSMGDIDRHMRVYARSGFHHL
ncbi:hypothetical protein JCM8097_001029 [Rhodosporidiobolus ruineniae]